MKQDCFYSRLVYELIKCKTTNIAKEMVNLFDRFPSLANLNEVEEINPLRRAYSDNHVNISSDSNTEESALSVSTNRTNVGEKIIVSWKLSHSPSSKDWLGLFYANGKSETFAILFYTDQQ